MQMLNQYGIPIRVHTVLTKCNESVEDMQSVYNVIKDLERVVSWHIVIGEPSLYPKSDLDISISPSAMNRIVDYLNSLDTDISIHAPSKAQDSNNPSSTVIIDFEKQKESFFSRSFCSGLFSTMYILPDGQVTMCEQLYWNKDFIIGNVLYNSILNVWNSEKACSIYYIKQKDIPSDSLCHSCKQFEQCRTYKQVCYREIVRKHGAQKWYYPDVNCIFVN